MVSFLIGFILGVVVVAAIFLAVAAYWVRKLKKIKAKITDEMNKGFAGPNTTYESIIARLKQVQVITDQQLAIQGARDQPSKNALHSRYKNDLIQDIKKLEEEKMAILQSILDDGFDPLMNILDENGQKQELPLSHFVNKAPPSAPLPTAPPSSSKRVGKFTLVKGGKDDGTIH